MAIDAWNKFHTAADVALDHWNSKLNRNFGSAYERALNSFKDTLERQEEADREAAEQAAKLMFLALSLCGGSVLTVLAAKSVAKEATVKLASDAALKVVCGRGWDKAFEALAWADGSPTANFVLGEAWDFGMEKMSERVKTSLAERTLAISNFPPQVNQAKGPVEFNNMLIGYSERMHAALLTTGEWLLETSGESALRKLQDGSPFLKTPKKELDIAKTAQDIELAFWMKYMLDSDYLEQGKIQIYDVRVGGMIRRHKTDISKKPIMASPSAGNYPKSVNAGGAGGSYSEVHYRQAGSIVKAAINDRHSQVLGGPFFLENARGYSRVSKETLRSAELALRQLASRNGRMIKEAVAH